MQYINELKEKDIILDRMATNALVWRRWIELYQDKHKIEEYFLKRDIKKIAIYGMADMGIALYRELILSDVEVSYCIDRSRCKCEYDVEMRTPDTIDSDVDMIVVAPVSHFPKIYEDLNGILDNKVPIVGIDEIIIDLLMGEK